MTIARDGTTRDGNGRWAKGTPSPNPNGRPPKRVEEARIETLGNVWDLPTLELLAKRVLFQALSKESTERERLASQEMILRYMVPVASKLEITRGDLEELADLSDAEIEALTAAPIAGNNGHGPDKPAAE